MRKYHKHCRYCWVEFGAGAAPTWDHVVPKWVLAYYDERFKRNARFRAANLVTACLPCNNAKGSMPVAAFLKLRLKPEKLTEVRTEWDIIAAQVRRGDRLVHQERVYAEFGKPIPPHFSTGQQKIEIRAGATVERTAMFLEPEA